jgi:hypothetical protein
MTELSVVPIEKPKRIGDLQAAVEALIEGDEFGRLSVAETMGMLQVVILNLYRRFQDDE